SAADVVIGIADHVDGAVRRCLHQYAASIVTITRAGGTDRGGAQHRSLLAMNQSTACNSPGLFCVLSIVMPRLDPGIHAVAPNQPKCRWNEWPGSSQAMTKGWEPEGA